MPRADDPAPGVPDLPGEPADERQTSVHGQPVEPEPAAEAGARTPPEQAMAEDARSREVSREEGTASEPRRDEPADG